MEGAFLLMAIERVRPWFGEAGREGCVELKGKYAYLDHTISQLYSSIVSFGRGVF
jgi:hypothetical protein